VPEFTAVPDRRLEVLVIATEITLYQAIEYPPHGTVSVEVFLPKVINL
jgi:hypothetical protein